MIKKLNGKNIFSASTDSYGSHIFVIDKINEIISFLNDRFPSKQILTPEEMDKQLDELYKDIPSPLAQLNKYIHTKIHSLSNHPGTPEEWAKIDAYLDCVKKIRELRGEE